MSVESYECIICGKSVNDNIVVNVYINPPDNSWEKEGSTPYLLNITPCCGERACVEAAWEQVKNSTIGEIEIEKAEAIEEDEPD